MPDYGNDLQFGTFVTPTVAQPELPVALAEISEQAGMDLVTFQDHPYQPAFQDTWTLLSYVAARTRRVHLAPNVLSLPLRQPAVMARAAAGLDLLTGGRLELGLGAGAFWDPIVAMGGPRRSPGESVEALAEAIEIMRGIWDVDDRGVLKVDGRHYAVAGAKRGPAPAHPIGLWLGAYRPRMLRLIGRSGDGWLPSWGYLKSAADLSEGNEVIDEAAAASGRDPRSIRRLLNISGRFAPRSAGFLQGPVEQWVDELAGLAIEHGVDTFILAADDAGLIERFGAEVAPAAREAVAAIRAGAIESSGGNSAGDHGAPESISTSLAAEYERLGVIPTVDPGVRLAAEQPWDESARPHRTESGPNVRYTDQGRQVGAHLIEVHDMLRSELAQVRELIDQVRAGQLGVGAARSAINQMTMRQNNWTLGAYCASYCRVVTQHHSMEDQAVFPHLARQDADLAPVIRRLEDEHVVIHEVLDGVDRALVALATDPAALDGVQQAVDLLTDTLLSHLSYEEVELVEPLARLGFYPGQV